MSDEPSRAHILLPPSTNKGYYWDVVAQADRRRIVISSADKRTESRRQPLCASPQ